jgi:WD40 repeat protein
MRRHTVVWAIALIAVALVNSSCGARDAPEIAAPTAPPRNTLPSPPERATPTSPNAAAVAPPATPTLAGTPAATTIHPRTIGSSSIPSTVTQGHTAEVIGAVFSPDSQRILTASEDCTARVWDLSGKQLAIMQGHTSGLTSAVFAVFSPDGQRILTASEDCTARVWDLSGTPLGISVKIQIVLPAILTKSYQTAF